MRAGGRLLALADAAEQRGQVSGGEPPVEWPGGAVVAVHEGQQGIAEGAQAGEVAGGEDFLLDDGKDDLYLVEPGCVHWRVDHDRVRVRVAEPVGGGLAAVIGAVV